MSSSRVLIPNNVRNMIQDIREITGKHSDEDIYTVLKDCNMDPNETAQRLLYLGNPSIYIYIYIVYSCLCFNGEDCDLTLYWVIFVVGLLRKRNKRQKLD
ncbi:hypothetical protein CsSME_00025970 [Camellia sinensis var. sinensis]